MCSSIAFLPPNLDRCQLVIKLAGLRDNRFAGARGISNTQRASSCARSGVASQVAKPPTHCGKRAAIRGAYL